MTFPLRKEQVKELNEPRTATGDGSYTKSETSDVQLVYSIFGEADFHAELWNIEAVWRL